MPLTTLLSILKQNWPLALILAGLAVFAVIHLVWYIKPSDIGTLADLQAHLHNGEPTIVEFYSNL